jgi:chloramphenicol 3-O phosphotransferase
MDPGNRHAAESTAIPDLRGQVIILNGTGSSGKSTLARALQVVVPCPLIHLGIDTLITRLPGRYVGDRPEAADGLYFKTDQTGLIEALEAGPAFHALVRGMHRAVAGLAAAGNGVVMDHVIWNDDWLNDCATILPNAFFVGVRCDLKVAQRRTLLRRDRPPGYEAFGFKEVHQCRPYDVEVDTTNDDIDLCTASIIRRLRAGAATGLATLKRRQSAVNVGLHVEIASLRLQWVTQQ